MKIVEKKKDFSICFEDIKCGDIFEYDEAYWLKIRDSLKNEYYGVNVASGKIYGEFEFSDNCRVVNAELHILD